MSLAGQAALSELWKQVKANFGRKLSINPASTTVDVNLQSNSGTTLSTGTLPAATGTSAGVLTAADKTKLDGIEAGAQKNIDPTKAQVVAALGYTPAQADTTDLASMTGTLGVGHGGTGATTAAAARTNLSVYSKAEVDDAITTAQTGMAMYKGSASAEADISGTAYRVGWYWVIGTAGTYFGQLCEVGDMVFANSDKGTSAVSSDFDIIQTNTVEMTVDEVDAICTV